MPPRRELVKWQGLTPKPSEFFGFIYRVTNMLDGRRYIGKKQYHRPNPKRSRKKPIADTTGKWNPDHWLASDWATYTGSCKELNADIKEHGMHNFTFEIIAQCACRGDLSYTEVEMLVKLNTLTLRDEDDNRVYYNGNISAIKFIPPNKKKETI
jgi:hypothetical protein